MTSPGGAVRLNAADRRAGRGGTLRQARQAVEDVVTAGGTSLGGAYGLVELMQQGSGWPFGAQVTSAGHVGAAVVLGLMLGLSVKEYQTLWRGMFTDLWAWLMVGAGGFGAGSGFLDFFGFHQGIGDIPRGPAVTGIAVGIAAAARVYSQL